MILQTEQRLLRFNKVLMKGLLILSKLLEPNKNKWIKVQFNCCLNSFIVLEDLYWNDHFEDSVNTEASTLISSYK